MKINILQNIIIGFLFTSCVAQNDRIENVIMDCSYQSFADNGKGLKTLIADYEKLLINENILPDNSGKSYRQVLQKIADRNEFDKIPSKFFANELQKLEKPDLEKAQECQKIIVKDSASCSMSKLKSLELVLTNAQNSADLQPSLIASDILKVLSEEDFELDFYKIRTFFLFNMIEPDSGFSTITSENEESQIEQDFTNALKIYLDDKSEIYVDNKKVTIKELMKLVREYELENKDKSIISLKNDSKTMYKTYIEVQNVIVEEIRHLRENLAREKYNIELDKLSEEQLTEIKKIFPQNIME
jgi:Biopolymer transport protein ExbD/TolR